MSSSPFIYVFFPCFWRHSLVEGKSEKKMLTNREYKTSQYNWTNLCLETKETEESYPPSLFPLAWQN